MRPATKKYDTSYKKKIDTHRDTFLPRQSPKGIIQCAGCGIFYYRRHWSLEAPAGITMPDRLHPIYCPACRKIKERCASGELHISGLGGAERGEVMRLLRNQEAQARQKNTFGKNHAGPGCQKRLEIGFDDRKAGTAARAFIAQGTGWTAPTITNLCG